MRQATLQALTKEEELGILDELIDLETGVIRELIQPGVGFEDPDWFLGIAMPSRIWNTGLFAGRHNLSEGNAVGETNLGATLGAIGETLERYCLAFYDRRELAFTSYIDAGAHGLRDLTDPDSFALFAPEQRVSWCVPFTRESPAYWTAGVSLAHKRTAWAPAQFVYLPYAPGPDEDYVFTSSSTGAAFGSTLEGAALSGLCETIERDAFAIHWLNRLERPALDIFSEPDLAAWYARLFGKYDNQLLVYDITTDLGVPCFFAVLRGRPGRAEPFMSVGAACHPDPLRALKKTVLEAFHTRRYGMNLMWLERADVQGFPSSAETNRFHAHVLRYTQPVPEPEIAFCCAPKRTLPIGDALEAHRARGGTGAGGAALKACVERLRAHGYDAIAFDVTTDEIAEKGFYTLKVLVPGLHPLWAGEDVPLGGRRIYDVPPRLGFQRKRREEMNLFPHPFP
jgi:ribosomal protein S12 methylthiotransferase accessory factor